MRIAIFAELYLPHVGGQEVRFAELGKALLAQGHEVSVFCVGHARGLKAREDLNGIQVSRFPITDKYERPFWKPLRRSPKIILKYALWCRRIAGSNQYDAHIYNQWPLGHILFAPKNMRCRSVIDWCEVRQGSVFHFIQSWLPRMAGTNVAVSPAIQAHLARVSGLEVECIPSGIFTEKYRWLDRSQRDGILYFGRIAPHKNISLLISAYSQLRGTGYLGRLVIAGTGPSLGQIRTEADGSQFAEFIDVLGFVSDEQKIDLLAHAAVMAVPSKREGFPRVVAEAMASGLPVVTVDYPENGTKDVVQHYGVGVVASPHPESFSAAILDVEQNWSRYSQAGLKAASSLHWSNICERFIRAVQKRPSA